MRSEDPNLSQDIWRPSLKTVKSVIAAGVIGALCGAAVSKLTTPRWTAEMTIQIGQLPKFEGDSTTNRLIEPQATAADRFNQPSSRSQVLSALGLPAPDEMGSRDSKLIYSSLRASIGRSADLINVEVSAYSRDEARKALDTSYKLLSAEHQKLFEPTVKRMNSDIAAISEKLKAAEKDYDASYSHLQEGVAQRNAPNGGVRDLMLTNMAVLSNGQTIELRRQVIRMQQSLDSAWTYPTRALGNIYAPTYPKTPGMLIYIVAGAAIGLTFGGLFAIRRIFIRPETAV